MRSELMENLSTLADPDEVQRGDRAYSSLDLAVHFLYDDSPNLADNPSSAIGFFLYSEAEADAVGQVIAALDRVFSVYGTEVADADYPNTPEWNAVVDSAKRAIETLLSNTGE